jgi:hypothetical protein
VSELEAEPVSRKPTHAKTRISTIVELDSLQTIGRPKSTRSAKTERIPSTRRSLAGALLANAAAEQHMRSTSIHRPPPHIAELASAPPTPTIARSFFPEQGLVCDSPALQTSYTIVDSKRNTANADVLSTLYESYRNGSTASAKPDTDKPLPINTSAWSPPAAAGAKALTNSPPILPLTAVPAYARSDSSSSSRPSMDSTRSEPLNPRLQAFTNGALEGKAEDRAYSSPARRAMPGGMI